MKKTYDQYGNRLHTSAEVLTSKKKARFVEGLIKQIHSDSDMKRICDVEYETEEETMNRVFANTTFSDPKSRI